MFEAAMITIAQNSYYEFKVNTERNLICMKIVGYWANVSEVPFFLTHLKEALGLVKPGFTVLADVREMEVFPPDVLAMHLEAQKATVAAGIYQLVEVHDPANSSISQVESVAMQSKIPLNIFNSMEDAEAWLADLQ